MTHLGCGGIVAHFLEKMTLENVRNWLNVWRRYGQDFGVLFVRLTGQCFLKTTDTQLLIFRLKMSAVLYKQAYTLTTKPENACMRSCVVAVYSQKYDDIIYA